MLIKFSVSNYGAIRDKVTIDFDKPVNLILGKCSSGKTTFFNAIRLFEYLVAGTGYPKPADLPVSPFLFDYECQSKAASFEASFAIDNDVYYYGFDVLLSSRTILKECLSKRDLLKGKNVKTLLARDGSTIEVHSGRCCKEVQEILNVAARAISNNSHVLFLGEILLLSQIDGSKQSLLSGCPFFSVAFDIARNILLRHPKPNLQGAIPVFYHADKQEELNIIESLKVFDNQITSFSIGAPYEPKDAIVGMATQLGIKDDLLSHKTAWIKDQQNLAFIGCYSFVSSNGSLIIATLSETNELELEEFAFVISGHCKGICSIKLSLLPPSDVAYWNVLELLGEAKEQNFFVMIDDIDHYFGPDDKEFIKKKMVDSCQEFKGRFSLISNDSSYVDAKYYSRCKTTIFARLQSFATTCCLNDIDEHDKDNVIRTAFKSRFDGLSLLNTSAIPLISASKFDDLDRSLFLISHNETADRIMHFFRPKKETGYFYEGGAEKELTIDELRSILAYSESEDIAYRENIKYARHEMDNKRNRTQAEILQDFAIMENEPGIVIPERSGHILSRLRRENTWRGENHNFASSRSSLDRVLDALPDNESKAAYECICQMRIIQFQDFLRQFSFIQEFEKQYVNCSYKAIAQHYGFRTHLLDFSDDLLSSLFFATCKENSNGSYEPLTDEEINKNEQSKYGVIYHCPTWKINGPSATLAFGISEDKEQPQIDDVSMAGYASQIGYQPLKRSNAQSGYLISTNGTFDLRKDKSMERFIFRNSGAISKVIFDFMEKGEKVFPKEGIDLASGAIAEIKRSKVFSKKTFEEAYETAKTLHDIEIERLLDVVIHFGGVSGDEGPFQITDEGQSFPLSKTVKKKIEKQYNLVDLFYDLGITSTSVFAMIPYK